MTYRAFFLLSLLTLVACDRVRKPRAAGAGGPTVRATVVTIRQTVSPAKQSWNHALVIGPDGRARNLGELDVWRLFDTRAGTVTFVDNIGRTARTVKVADLVRERRATMSNPVAGWFPRPALAPADKRRTMAGVEARLSVIEAGEYRRELWIGRHPDIPAGLFAMMYASDEPSTPLAPMMRAADAALLDLEGFPLADHAALPLGSQRMTVDRVVVSVEKKDVSASLLEVPREFLDLTPKQ